LWGVGVDFSRLDRSQESPELPLHRSLSRLWAGARFGDIVITTQPMITISVESTRASLIEPARPNDIYGFYSVLSGAQCSAYERMVQCVWAHDW
jgi:hypothetical protein